MTGPTRTTIRHEVHAWQIGEDLFDGRPYLTLGGGVEISRTKYDDHGRMRGAIFYILLSASDPAEGTQVFPGQWVTVDPLAIDGYNVYSDDQWHALKAGPAA